MEKDIFDQEVYSTNTNINIIIHEMGRIYPAYIDYHIQLQNFLKDRAFIDEKINQIRNEMKDMESKTQIKIMHGTTKEWIINSQEYFSEKSSIRQVPAGFFIVDKYFGWQGYTVNLDLGGGKYDLMTKELEKMGVTNYIYDPYNRTTGENQSAYESCANGKSDTVTIFNVLNVIKEKEIQIQLLLQAENALKIGGTLYVRSTYKNNTGISGVTKSGTFQHALSQKNYLEIVKEVFLNANLEHGIIWATK